MPIGQLSSERFNNPFRSVASNSPLLKDPFRLEPVLSILLAQIASPGVHLASLLSDGIQLESPIRLAVSRDISMKMLIHESNFERISDRKDFDIATNPTGEGDSENSEGSASPKQSSVFQEAADLARRVAEARAKAIEAEHERIAAECAKVLFSIYSNLRSNVAENSSEHNTEGGEAKDENGADKLSEHVGFGAPEKFETDFVTQYFRDANGARALLVVFGGRRASNFKNFVDLISQNGGRYDIKIVLPDGSYGECSKIVDSSNIKIEFYRGGVGSELEIEKFNFQENIEIADKRWLDTKKKGGRPEKYPGLRDLCKKLYRLKGNRPSVVEARQAYRELSNLGDVGGPSNTYIRRILADIERLRDQDDTPPPRH